MIQEAINKAVNRENLNYEIAEEVMNEIITGEATPAQIAGLLTAMHIKGEHIDEITAFASIMRKSCGKFESDEYEIMDIVGTGGDNSSSINISTLAAIIVSAGGVKVAKHGNRAASSKCGTADVLELLGVNIMAKPEISLKALKEIGMCFLFAQKYHPYMKYVGSVRREIKIPTIFNFLGPLANPAKANVQLLGVNKEDLVEPLARVLSNLEVKRAMVVHGQDSLDEISLSAPTTVCEVNNGIFKSYIINPEDYGFELCKKEDIAGGTPEENAEFALEILSGGKGHKRNAVVLNAAAAFYISKGMSIEDGIVLAEHIIDSGKALDQLYKFASITREIA